MNIIQRQDVPSSSWTAVSQRRVGAAVIHHTAGPRDSMAPRPRAGASWHYLILGSGAIWSDVPEQYAAHHVAAANRWRPSWLLPAPPNAGVSDVNVWSCGIELHYAPQSPFNEVPTPAQTAALRELLADLERRHGRLPVVGHGQLQLDRWPSEPHGLEWNDLGLTRDAEGTYWRTATPLPPTPPQEEPMPTPEQQLVLDAAARHGLDAAGIDQMAGITAELQRQLDGQTYNLSLAQAERDAIAADAERLRAALAACQAELDGRPTAPAVASASVQVTLSSGHTLTVPLMALGSG